MKAHRLSGELTEPVNSVHGALEYAGGISTGHAIVQNHSTYVKNAKTTQYCAGALAKRFTQGKCGELRILQSSKTD